MPKTNPHEKSMDDTLALLREGYLYIKNRMDKHKSDLFQTHLLGQEAICMSGKEAAEIFYDMALFARKDAAPKRVQKTLTGESTVQGMDGDTHLRRKFLFMLLTTKQHPETLADLAAKEWEAAVARWETSEKIVLFDEAKIILCKIACKWAGVPLLETEAEERADDFAAMVDAFGAVGPRHWKGRIARPKTERWIKNIIENVRSGRLKVSENSALYAIANYKEIDENLLDAQTAAKELINLLRPIVAISTYITFMALALYEHPEYKDFLLSDADAPYMFVEEVRRFYPFTPFVGAKVKEDFVWNGCEFKTGMLVLLDIYGINHDSRIWEKPFEFQPERFRNRQYDSFEFVSHGGGDPANGHRCPGEIITVEVMKMTLDFLIKPLPGRNYYCGFIIDEVKPK